MLGNWDKNTPGRVESVFASLQNIAPSQLADRDLFDFAALQLKAQEANKSEVFADDSAGLGILQ